MLTFVKRKEKASIDEAFIDFTKPVREILLQRYPYLTQVPPEGVDIPLPPAPSINWDGLGNLIPVNPPLVDEDKVKTEVEGTRAIDPEKKSVNEEEIGDLQTTWHDVALSIAAELMSAAKEQVRTKLGYTTSAVRYRFLIFFGVAMLNLCRASRGTNSLQRHFN